MHKIIYTGLEAPRDKQTYLWKKKDENGNVALYEYKGTKWEKVAEAQLPAQQYHLYIDLNRDIEDPAAVMSLVGSKLLECAKAGTILDVVLRYIYDKDTVALAPIVYAFFTNTGITVSWVYEEGILMGSYTQE